jgi:hypothetical protein
LIKPLACVSTAASTDTGLLDRWPTAFRQNAWLSAAVSFLAGGG